jgi:GNAT superfamily N-acetyltransferase
VSPASSDEHTIDIVTPADLGDLLVLMRAYCDFYRSSPSDGSLLELSRSLLADPVHEGLQLIARDSRAAAAGFATIFWTWSTTTASRIAVMNDLYLAPEARGRGLAGRLIDACAERSAEAGATRLEWQTAPENARAQAVYDRAGASQERWLTYFIDLAPA